MGEMNRGNARSDNEYERALQAVDRARQLLAQACRDFDVPAPGEAFDRFPINFTDVEFDRLIDLHENVLLAMRTALRHAPAERTLLERLRGLRQWRQYVDHLAHRYGIVEHRAESEDDDELFTTHSDVNWPAHLQGGQELRAELIERLGALRDVTTPADRQLASDAVIAVAQTAWRTLPHLVPDEQYFEALSVCDKLDRLIVHLQSASEYEAAEKAGTSHTRKRKRDTGQADDQGTSSGAKRRRGDDGAAIPSSSSPPSADLPDQEVSVDPASASGEEVEADWPAGWPSSEWEQTRRGFLNLCVRYRGYERAPAEVVEWAEAVKAALEAEQFDGEAASRREAIVRELDELVSLDERAATADEDTGSSSGPLSAGSPADPLADIEYIWPSALLSTDDTVATLRTRWVEAYLSACAAEGRAQWAAVAEAAQAAMGALGDADGDLSQRLRDHVDAVNTMLAGA